MPQQTTVKLPSGEEGIVIYPDGKRLKKPVYNEEHHHVVVHYEEPHQPDIAEPPANGGLIFVVTSAVVPGVG